MVLSKGHPVGPEVLGKPHKEPKRLSHGIWQPRNWCALSHVPSGCDSPITVRTTALSEWAKSQYRAAVTELSTVLGKEIKWLAELYSPVLNNKRVRKVRILTLWEKNSFLFTLHRAEMYLGFNFLEGVSQTICFTVSGRMPQSWNSGQNANKKLILLFFCC